MMNLVFNCKFLSDVVLNAQTATEGSQETLDYIPGSNFLGIMAKEYLNYGNEKAFDLFHSGKVRFGDAHLFIGQRLSKTPLTWYKKKSAENSNETNIYVHHRLPDDFKISVRLKQERQGFFYLSGEEITRVSLKKKFFHKSAQDRKKRRSANEKMFGYEALPAGTEWEFKVQLDKDAKEFKEDIIDKLQGRHFIGRSRTAQFGRINISFIKEEAIESSEIDTGVIELYADSNLCFFNEYGYPTLNPSIADLGLPENCQVDWEKSQLRTISYSPWNFKRSSRDPDRICIAKGSVFIINTNGAKIKTEPILRGVGSYISEGLGAVVINPEFLKTDTNGALIYTVKEAKLPAEKKNGHPGNNLQSLSADEERLLCLLKSLNEKKQKDQNTIKLKYEFNENFGEDFRKLSSSQWGGVREIASRSENYDQLINKLFGSTGAYLMHGIAKEQWDKNNRREKLQNFLIRINRDKECDPVEFTMLLSSFMAKQASQK